MFAICIDCGTWKLTMADGRKISGHCPSNVEALHAATAAAARLEELRKATLRLRMKAR